VSYHVAVLPKLKGAIAVPVDPIYFESIATPSVEEAPPGNWAYPKMPPPIVQTHRLSVVVGEVQEDQFSSRCSFMSSVFPMMF
jgi:hypothetical protein